MFVRMNKMMKSLPRCFALLGVLLVFCAPTAAQPIALTEPAEIALAKHLMNLGFTLQAAAEECRPNYLCNYLHELAGLYSSFYEACPVLKAEELARSTRFALCRLSAQALRLGLETLGIEVTEKM